jgi:hypothetical protein
LRRRRDGAAKQGSGCKRQSGKLAEARDHIHLEHLKLEHTGWNSWRLIVVPEKVAFHVAFDGRNVHAAVLWRVEFGR